MLESQAQRLIKTFVEVYVFLIVIRMFLSDWTPHQRDPDAMDGVGDILYGLDWIPYSSLLINTCNQAGIDDLLFSGYPECFGISIGLL